MKASPDDRPLTIGALAAAFDLTTAVLRHWETKGLLRPTRAASGARRYKSSDCYRVAAIIRAKAAGFTLDQIRDLLHVGAPGTRRTLLQGHRESLTARIEAAQRSLAMLDSALACEHGDVATCPKFTRLLGTDIDAAFGTTHGT